MVTFPSQRVESLALTLLLLAVVLVVILHLFSTGELDTYVNSAMELLQSLSEVSGLGL